MCVYSYLFPYEKAWLPWLNDWLIDCLFMCFLQDGRSPTTDLPASRVVSLIWWSEVCTKTKIHNQHACDRARCLLYLWCGCTKFAETWSRKIKHSIHISIRHIYYYHWKYIQGDMFRPYRAIIRSYYKNRFVHFQYILGSQIVYKGGMMLQCCVLLLRLKVKLIVNQARVVNLYKNLRSKLLKCCANIYFNRRCLT